MTDTTSALLELNPRQRKFIAALADDPISPGAKIRAARRAGYGSTSSSAVCMRNIARRVSNNDTVQRAIHEVAYKEICGDILRYVENLKVVANNPQHRHHVKANLELLAIGGLVARTEHTVKVQHSVDTRDMEALVLRLAAETGIPANRLLGNDAKLIEGTAVELSDGTSRR